jgi:hypothetical protein
MLFTTLIFCLISTVAGKGVHLIWSWQTGAVDMSAPTDSLVTVNLFPDFATCGATKPRTMYLKANKYSTLDSAKGLRVVRHDDGVKYNARKYDWIRIDSIND